MSEWAAAAWQKITTATIKKTWNHIGCLSLAIEDVNNNSFDGTDNNCNSNQDYEEKFGFANKDLNKYTFLFNDKQPFGQEYKH
jgi:hypothetical protein